MRRIVYDAAAARELENQIDFLIQKHVVKAAADLEARIDQFLHDHLRHFPATGTDLQRRGLWEFPVYKTKLVIWYRFDDTQIQVVHIWHSSQDRPAIS